MYGTDGNGVSDGMQMSELHLLRKDGRPVPYAHLTASGESNYGSTDTCSQCVQNAVDGSRDTKWFSQINRWLTITFSQPHCISGMDLFTADDVQSRDPYSFELQCKQYGYSQWLSLYSSPYITPPVERKSSYGLVSSKHEHTDAVSWVYTGEGKNTAGSFGMPSCVTETNIARDGSCELNTADINGGAWGEGGTNCGTSLIDGSTAWNSASGRHIYNSGSVRSVTITWSSPRIVNTMQIYQLAGNRKGNFNLQTLNDNGVAWTTRKSYPTVGAITEASFVSDGDVSFTLPSPVTTTGVRFYSTAYTDGLIRMEEFVVLGCTP